MLLRRPAQVLVAAPDAVELQGILAGADLTARAVAEPVEAIAALHRWPADVLLVAWDGAFDGAALCRAARADPAQETATWVIAIVGAGSTPTAALAAGADDYLRRPFGAAELATRVAIGMRVARQRQDDELLRTLVANVPGAIYRSAWDRNYELELMSDEIERITGYPASDFSPGGDRTIMSIIHPDDLPRVLKEAEAVLDDGELFVLEYRLVGADGGERHVVDRAQFAPNRAGRRWMDGVIFDVTDIRIAQETQRRHAVEAVRAEELRAASTRIVEASDAARRRIERDLHDGAQQRLVTLGLQIALARARAETDPASAPAALDVIGNELTVALAELRELARGIHPAILSQHGLAAAAEALAARSTVPVELEELPQHRFVPAVEATAYFTIAEALTNVAKYAQATSAAVRVTEIDHEVVIEVRDDGVGGAAPSPGSGLAGLADRVGAHGGTLTVSGEPGEGTLVCARIPI